MNSTHLQANSNMAVSLKLFIVFLKKYVGKYKFGTRPKNWVGKAGLHYPNL